MSDEDSIQRAIAQQLASLAAAGVQQVGVGTAIGGSAQATNSDVLAAEHESTLPVQVREDSSVPATSKTESGSESALKAPSLEVLAEQVAACTLCDELCGSRTQTVFGVGSPEARLCFLGEAPGADEDRIGEPFVGKAGQLLTKIIGAMGLTRDDVYILNVLKCRPPGNRNPAPEEVANCRSFFETQLSLIQPEFICCLGAVATQNLLDTTTSISKMRGKFQEWNGYQVMATYHPAYLLRNPSAKKQVWEDMQMLMKAMGLEPPKK